MSEVLVVPEPPKTQAPDPPMMADFDPEAQKASTPQVQILELSNDVEIVESQTILTTTLTTNPSNEVKQEQYTEAKQPSPEQEPKGEEEKQQETSGDEEEKAKKQRRNHIVDEILQSERTYLIGLKFIVEKCLVPLRDSDILKPEQIEMIFCNIEEITAVSEELLLRLETRVNSQWSESDSIGDLFIKIVRFLLT